MSINNEDEKKRQSRLNQDEEEGGSESGTGTAGGGAAGEIEFRYQDILSVGLRDDLVTGKELKRILAVHGDTHKARVDNQKNERKQRKFAKEGQATLTSRSDAILAHRARGGSGGGSSPYKEHNIARKAQFSGIDRKVKGLPSDNLIKTNEAARDQLEENQNRNELRNTLTNKYRNTPKPRPH